MPRPITPQDVMELLGQCQRTVAVTLGGYTFGRLKDDPRHYYFAFGAYPECLRTCAPPTASFVSDMAKRFGLSWMELSEEDLAIHHHFPDKGQHHVHHHS